MKRVMLILSCLFISIGFITAQTTRITGVVVDNAGEPVISASVVVKGTTIGVSTDLDGKFSINVPEGKNTLVFSLIGMKTVEAKISQNMRAVMENDEHVLGDVVVTALGISRDAKALGYGSTTVQNNEITAAKSGSLMSGLVGKVAGLNISTAGGTGTSQKVIVRGFSSFTANQPLFVVDGVPIQNTFSGNSATNNSVDFGNLAGDINPEDIESVSVLKGASATALYGTRAASGVIMITTKKAKKNQKPTVTYTGTFSASNILRAPQTQDMFGEGWPFWDAHENGSWGPRLDGRNHIWGAPINGVYREKSYSYVKDNVKNFYDTGFEMNNNISFETSGEHTGIMVSYGNLTSDGIIPTDADKYTRNTISFRGNTKYDKLALTYNVNYSRKDIKALSAGQGGNNLAALFQEILQTPVDINLQDLKDINNPYNDIDNYYTPYAVNPYWVIANSGNKYVDNHTYGNIDATYEIMPGLKAIGRIGGDFNDSRRQAWNGIARFSPGSWSEIGGKSASEGSYLVHNESRTQLDVTGLLDANYKVNQDVNLSGFLGWNYNHRDLELIDSYLFSLNVPGWYSLENGNNQPTTYTRLYKRRLYGALGQAEFGFKDYLYVTLSGRNDWSSTLPKNKRSFFYWGANSSIIMTDALPSLKSNVLNYLKVRLAYGKTGNDANWYLVSNEYQPVDINLGFGNIKMPLNNVPGLTIGNRRGNDNLKPEITREAEFGFDVRMFDSRVTLDFSYYDRNTKDQIIASTLPYETGFTQYTRNIGEISNKGVEIALGLVPIRTKDWNWNLNVTFAKNKSKVVDLWDVDGNEVNEYRITGAYGVDFVAVKGRELGVFKVPKLQTHEGKVVVGSYGYPLIEAGATEEVGTSAPKFTMGFVNRVSWKNLTFGVVVDWRNGGKFWSNTAEMMTWNGNATNTLYNERQPFLIPNSVKVVNGQYVENDIPVTSYYQYRYYTHNANQSMYRNFVISKSFVKLRELSLSYNFPKSVVAKLGPVKQLELAFIGRNLFMWTPKENNFVDPEGTNYGNDLTSELGEFTAAPTTRTFGGSIKVTF